jgi:hypothetical protein
MPWFAYLNCMIVPTHQARGRAAPAWGAGDAGQGGKIARSS